ncbi:hypothetical protein [Flagellimonas lutaonensis]|uniref:hypothetical protein n=1 Tax=Flagellimonas lutaonensis TaxID=516051 RepID=UPI0005F76D49|nr:hypothetical protein [Allomuricauda lutaonensis]
MVKKGNLNTQTIGFKHQKLKSQAPNSKSQFGTIETRNSEGQVPSSGAKSNLSEPLWLLSEPPRNKFFTEPHRVKNEFLKENETSMVVFKHGFEYIKPRACTKEPEPRNKGNLAP